MLLLLLVLIGPKMSGAIQQLNKRPIGHNVHPSHLGSSSKKFKILIP